MLYFRLNECASSSVYHFFIKLAKDVIHLSSAMFRWRVLQHTAWMDRCLDFKFSRIVMWRTELSFVHLVDEISMTFSNQSAHYLLPVSELITWEVSIRVFPEAPEAIMSRR